MPFGSPMCTWMLEWRLLKKRIVRHDILKVCWKAFWKPLLTLCESTHLYVTVNSTQRHTNIVTLKETGVCALNCYLFGFCSIDPRSAQLISIDCLMRNNVFSCHEICLFLRILLSNATLWFLLRQYGRPTYKTNYKYEPVIMFRNIICAGGLTK